MKINQVVILRKFEEKIDSKHQISVEEIREVFQNYPHFRKLEKGRVLGEDLYGAYGQTDSGRYLSVFFIYKINNNAFIISARDMNKTERKSMPKNRVLPKFQSYEEASEWLDSHSTAKLESTEVQFEVAKPLKILIIDSLSEIEDTISLEKKISRQIREIARRKGISTQTLIQKWLQEKVDENLRL